MNNIELAWAAGFFDGEGSSCLCMGYASIHLGQTDPEVLERFQKAVGEGGIHGPYELKNPNWKPKWEYKAVGNSATIAMEKILPYLGSVKRKQWENTLSKAKIPRRRGFCANDLHEMTEVNQYKVNSRNRTEIRCLECKRESDRKSAKRRYEKLKGGN